jgi:hypothetical protein
MRAHPDMPPGVQWLWRRHAKKFEAAYRSAARPIEAGDPRLAFISHSESAPRSHSAAAPA